MVASACWPRGAGKSKSWHEGKESEGRGSKCIPRAQSWGGHIYDQRPLQAPAEKKHTPTPGPQETLASHMSDFWAPGCWTLRWHLCWAVCPDTTSSSECHPPPRPLARLGRLVSTTSLLRQRGGRTSVQKSGGGRAARRSDRATICSWCPRDGAGLWEERNAR